MRVQREIHKPGSRDSGLNTWINSRLHYISYRPLNTQPQPRVTRKEAPSVANEGGVIPICRSNNEIAKKKFHLKEHQC
jgi:hypothetical protein